MLMSTLYATTSPFYQMKWLIVRDGVKVGHVSVIGRLTGLA